MKKEDGNIKNNYDCKAVVGDSLYVHKKEGAEHPLFVIEIILFLRIPKPHIQGYSWSQSGRKS